MDMRYLVSGAVCLALFILAVMIVRTFQFKPKRQSNDVRAGEQDNFNINAVQAAVRLQKAVSFKTISDEHYFQENKQAFLDFHKFLEEAFPRVHRFLKREIVNELSLVYTWEGSNRELKPVLLLAHMDVVPVDEKSAGEWVTPPFAECAESGYIWGRGTMDDKCCLMAILEAIEELLARGFLPERGVYLAFGHDEEIGGKNGAGKIAPYFRDKGLSFEYALDEGLLITKGVMEDISAPIAFVGIAEKGYVSLELTVKHHGGHSSMPERETAVSILSQAICRVAKGKFPARMQGPVRELLSYIGPHMPFMKKLVFANLWLTAPLVKKILAMKNTTNALVRTTVAPTMISGSIKDNVLPDIAAGVVNCRIIPGETVADVIARVQRIIHDPRVSVSPLPHYIGDPSNISSIDSAGFKEIEDAIGAVFQDVIVAPSIVLAGTDSRYYTEICENIFRFVPLIISDEDMKRIHGINERVAQENYIDMIRFYVKLLAVWR